MSRQRGSFGNIDFGRNTISYEQEPHAEKTTRGWFKETSVCRGQEREARLIALIEKHRPYVEANRQRYKNQQVLLRKVVESE